MKYFPGCPPDDFLKEEAEGPRPVAVAPVGSPVWRLCGEGLDNGLVIRDGQALPVDGGESGPVGEKFSQGDALLAGSCKLRPELGDGNPQGDSLFLQGMEGDGRGDTFAGGPDEAGSGAAPGNAGG